MPGDLELALFSEKSPGKGEDAPPLLDGTATHAYLGVFDGLGGSGEEMYATATGPHTGAYFAARAAAASALSFLRQHDGEDLHLRELAPDLALRLKQDLTKEYDRLTEAAAANVEGQASRLISKMQRRLPTTFAIAAVERRTPPGRGTKVQCLWAGDSRIYILRPEFGLQQLTRDHLVYEKDAFDNIYEDSPLANVVCLNQEIRLEYNAALVESPAIVLAATDGCFGYLASPMHFEELLLESLEQSRSLPEWEDSLGHRIRNTAGDDATLALFALGGSPLRGLKRAFQARLGHLRGAYGLDSGGPANSREELAGLWHGHYKPGYEALTGGSMRAAPGEDAESLPSEVTSSAENAARPLGSDEAKDDDT